MKFNLEKSPGVRIHAFDPGRVTLAVPQNIELPKGAEPATDDPGLCYITRNLIISSNAIHQKESPLSFAELGQAHIEFALAFYPEIILLGTGNILQFPEPQLSSIAASQGVGLEVMDTAAACRTFNILVGESRQVVAILLME